MPEGATPAANESIWVHKPWWCQPWSILLTGLAVVVISWIVLHLWWLTLMAVVGVLLWGGLFLILLPRAWAASVQTQPKA